MNAMPQDVRPPAAAIPPARLALLGTGNVGRAVLARLQRLAGAGAPLRLVLLSNSRTMLHDADGLDWRCPDPLQPPAGPACLASVAEALDGPGPRIVIDATASTEVAAMHARWLHQGIHVVTACKLAQGGDLIDWQRLRRAQAEGGTIYGDSATVGAGLPLLRTLRALRAGGDRIRAIAGILSGSLAWLFDGYDGSTPFSRRVYAARQAGYTEPDPRDDLRGLDVKRKLLILARCAGYLLEASAVRVEPLPGCDATGHWPIAALDGPMRERLQAARRRGRVLRHVARLHADGRAVVALEELAPGDPMAAGGGTDNRVAIWSDRYRERPLLVQGPGAGPDITAAALLDDVLAIRRACARRAAAFSTR